MDSLEELYSITLQLKAKVETSDKQERDKQIEEIVSYLEARGKILQELLTETLSAIDKNRLKEVLRISEDIISNLTNIKKEIQQDILLAKKGKSAFRGYNQMYTVPSFDGHYFDKKK
ncbi:hypothetical protein EKG37_02035 [Robertmurraya yapensis]|uniref:Flagellar protein FliT n=1 Tax=Bacillus yapensis TaxID=2492960 RepID=A0A3S0KX71_9BACI|nr:hypothetical protein [Bacillus yapensis]RTR36359.1 hypothetical protein EKG37_02035 [Bacillus yapensis]TKT05863.1 hypothetical protein FAR12_02035 [Bacillus yapensis]